MKVVKYSVLLLILTSTYIFAQGFNVKAKGAQTFSFKDSAGRNQATFFSKTPLEDFTGLSSDISGKVSFDVKDIKSTLEGKITVVSASIGTGIEKRDRHLKSDEWLDVKKYPEISYTIKKVTDVQKLSDNKLKVKVLGDFNLHGVTNEVPAEATLTYLDESPETQQREPGDLLGVQAKFKIKLSNYNIQNFILGKRVSDVIKINVNMVGTNKF